MTPQAIAKAKRDQFLVFGSPLIEEAEIREVVDTMRSGWLGTGPKVAKFEQQFREYTGAKHAMAVNSCTAGLHVSMLVAGLKHGDEVITTPMTFCATVLVFSNTIRPLIVALPRKVTLFGDSM